LNQQFTKSHLENLLPYLDILSFVVGKSTKARAEDKGLHIGVQIFLGIKVF